ncbi:MAG: hypothetical protein NTV43_08945 [Methylococcales bacterium]|nr:hypothetical protein [Methylococcales bacterium]
MLVIQITLKQWDKSQRTAADSLQRAAIPDCYPVIVPPAYYILGQACVLDLHGDAFPPSRLQNQTETDTVLIDHLQLSGQDVIAASYCRPGLAPVALGDLGPHWLQCKYNKRYSVFESGQFFWRYEEITINAASLDQANEAVFLSSEPGLVYTDIIELDSKPNSTRPSHQGTPP